jgi:CRISPR-associated endonuclease/helicase Cas3
MHYAHSLKGRPAGAWEELPVHLQAVALRAADFAAPFGWSEAARVAGLLHDIGKASPAFQAYIAQTGRDGAARGPDHSTAGAREAEKAYGRGLGTLLAHLVAGHHAGLADTAKLEERLSPERELEPYEGWRDHTGPLPPPAYLRPSNNWRPDKDRAGFSAAFLTRMLFSCLVDADFLETAAFYDRAEGRALRRGNHADLDDLRDRLRAHMAGLDGQRDDLVSRVRSRVLTAARAKAVEAPGLFTLTVPTGGGKTLASLTFALEHAVQHGLRRVIHVAPFTAIIEQTAQVFRDALRTETDVLEHHALAEWRDRGEDSPGGDSPLRLAAENWDVPVVVTTAVQFFESLFASRTSRCRKLHNLARSVIVLDEAQALPLGLLRPCLAALEELVRNYGASVVLCTATQPAVRVQDGMEKGLDIPDAREIAPDPPALYAALKRVRVEVLREPVPDTVIAARFAEASQMLCIVNSRAHARDLFEAIQHLPGALHLSTLMVPKHRRLVLDAVRDRVTQGLPVRIASTSLIEAGVDLDLPEVWRAVAGLDSIAQAAGRCNRNGRLSMGRVVVFEPAEAKPPQALRAFWQAARPLLEQYADDLLSLEAVRAYFGELYWQKGGAAALDARVIDGYPPGVLTALETHQRDGRFPFRSLDQAFRLIDESMEPVVVPWDAAAAKLLKAVGAMNRPSGVHLRQLQPYTVSIPGKLRSEWLQGGVLHHVHSALGEALLAFEDKAHYREHTGINLR